MTLGRLIVAVFVLALTADCCLSLYIGDSCVSRTGGQGICQQLSICQSAKDDLRKGIVPTTCTFDNKNPVVCCKTPREVGDISNEKCREYGTYVFVQRRISSNSLEKHNVSVCGVKAVALIVGGTKAKPKEFPHQAHLGYDISEQLEWKCGGSLISENYVLSAAHCAQASRSPVKYIRLGDLDVEKKNDDAGPEIYDVAEIIKHPESKPPIRYNDIMLLRTTKPVKFNRYIRPICLQTQHEIGPTREGASEPRYIATGWGKTAFLEEGSSHLLKVVLDNFKQANCSYSYRSTSKRLLPNGISEERQLCAGGTDMEKDTCQGDSGGPLQVYNKDVYCMYKLVGVTSFGKTCGVQYVPGVYTRVSYYIDWIEKTVWPQ